MLKEGKQQEMPMVAVPCLIIPMCSGNWASSACWVTVVSTRLRTRLSGISRLRSMLVINALLARRRGK